MSTRIVGFLPEAYWVPKPKPVIEDDSSDEEAVEAQVVIARKRKTHGGPAPKKNSASRSPKAPYWNST